jgi:undecaprenyl-diphosphatase
LNILELILLAVIQGLTEFLPVSSSGHLVLLQNMTGAFVGDVSFDIILHLGTLMAVLVVYRREVLRLLRFDAAAVQYIFAMFIGTLPAVAVGLLLKDWITGLFHSNYTTAAALIVTGLILLSTRRAPGISRVNAAEWQPSAPPVKSAFLIGCAQALAIMPGISRSGSTIAASLWLKLERAEAARFSFLLSVPAILGALVLNLLGGIEPSPAGTGWLVVGAFIAFLVGLVAIKLTALLVVQRHFWKFALYCLPLGVLVLIFG